MAEQYLNISGGIIVSLDVSGRVCRINKAGERNLGYGEGELIGKNWFDVVVPEVHRDQAQHDFEVIVSGGLPEKALCEYEALVKSGDRIYVRWSATAVRDAEGTIISVLMAGIDVTEQKAVEAALRESTARLQDFTDVASDWLWEMDADLKFSYLSTILDRVRGLSSDQILGKTRAELLATEDIDAPSRAKWDAHLDDLQSQRAFRDFEYQGARADGSVIYIRTSGKPIFDEHGQFTGYRGTGRDITQEVEAQQSASWAQELLLHTIEYVPTMMALFDAEERFVICNQSYRKTLHSIADLLVPGTTFEDISRIGAQRGFVTEFKDDPEGWVRARLKRFRNPGEPVIHQQMDGRWVMTSDHRTPDGGTLIMRTDISPIIKAEEDLRAKEATLQTFLDAMTDPAAMVDCDARFMIANRAMAQQHGVDPQDLAGKAMIKDPPTAIGKQRRAWIDAVVETGQPVQETDYYEGRWSDITVTPVFDLNGKVDQVAIVARDVTQDVEKEALLRKMSQATEQSADLVVITDVDGKIEYVNHKFVEATGYAAEDVIGKNPRILASGDTPRDVYRELWDTVLAGETWRGDLKDRCKDGTCFWAAVTIAPIHDTAGNLVNFVSSHVDIGDRKAAEDAMQEAVLRTEIANRAKGELLANMSHELRTPLNAIIGFSSMMNEGVYGKMDNPHYEEYSKIITSSAHHLLDIINDILDVSAIEAGKLKLHEEVFSVSEIISSTLHLIEHRADEGDVNVTSQVMSDAPYFYADARRFKQILLNLVSNAVKFTPEGGTVQVQYGVDGKGCPVLCVQDTGIGMDATQLKVALTQFGQADGSHTRKHEGTGLGLPLTMGLVEMHGGTMDVQSAKGKGTAITITFPKERVASQV